MDMRRWRSTAALATVEPPDASTASSSCTLTRCDRRRDSRVGSAWLALTTE